MLVGAICFFPLSLLSFHLSHLTWQVPFLTLFTNPANTLFTPQWHFPEDPPQLALFQSGSSPAKPDECPQLSLHWYPVTKHLLSSQHLVGSLHQHQCTAVCLQQMKLSLAASHTEDPSCTPACQQQLQSNPPASCTGGVGSSERGASLYTNLPTIV